MLDQIRVVLINTSHPGNIGATARAMKTMGLTDLVLVSPQRFPHADAVAMASNADDVLEASQVVSSLDEAIGDRQLVLGTSARQRYINIPLLTPREAVAQIKADITADMGVALLFGNERTGLTNAELKRCHYHVNIPTNPDYSSLNLAQAVQLLAYECRVGLLDMMPLPVSGDPLATDGEVEGFYQHLEQALVALEMLDRSNPELFGMKLRRLFQRARLTKVEVNMLRGMCKAICQK